MYSSSVQGLHGALEAFVQFVGATQQSVGGNPAIIKHNVAHMGAFLAHLAVWRAKRDSRGVSIHQKRADALSASGVLVSAAKTVNNCALGAFVM